jgi:hypothetical protein
MHIGDRGLVEKIVEVLLTLHQRLVRLAELLAILRSTCSRSATFLAANRSSIWSITIAANFVSITASAN